MTGLEDTMKNFFFKILGFTQNKSKGITFPQYPIAKPFAPDPYLLDGWLVASGEVVKHGDEVAFGWDPYLKLSMETDAEKDEKRASRSVGGQAHMCLPVQVPDDGDLIVAMEIRSFLSERTEEFKEIEVLVDGVKSGQWHLCSREPVWKLLIVPVRFPRKQKQIDITFLRVDSNDKEESGSVFGQMELGIELSKIEIFVGLDQYLSNMQSKYDKACDYRNELFEMEGQELQDRGELVDIVKNVLNVFKESDEDLSDAEAKLNAFLHDPYIQGRNDEKLCMDREYFSLKRDMFVEGRIAQEISHWRSGLYNFKEAVLDAGNYVFRQQSTEHKASSETLENFLQVTKLPHDKVQELKDKNEIVNNLEILLQKENLRSVPPFLEIEMTSFCNFRCVMCSRSMMKFLHAQQNDQQILEISKILPYVKHVTIAGVGEPCSSSKLDILSRVLELFQCKALMFTNGSLLHRQIDAASRLDTVNVSFDGPNERIMAAQRRNSKFKTIVENIQKLRANAPKLTIGFSVVVSRINVDEIADIVRVAGEVGANCVNLSPVVNVSLLELKKSDQALYEEQLQLAKEFAAESGVVIHNNVHGTCFSINNDTPREKEKLISYFAQLKVPTERAYKLEDVIKNLEKHTFSYFPDPILFIGNCWPKMTDSCNTVDQEDRSEKVSYQFDIDAEIVRLDQTIEELENELKATPKECFKLPYCLSVWKYGYVKSNGKNRLCPHRNVALGSYRDAGAFSVLNSSVIQKYRHSMLQTEDVTSMCRECADHHRTWSIDSLRQTAGRLGIDIDKLPRCQ